jgi:hypothetical protein
MLISTIKNAINTYYTEIYGAIYDAAWTAYTQITPQETLPVVALKYVETAGYLAAWALRWTIMTARIKIIAEDAPIPYLRAFYNKADFYEQDRDLTAEELFDLFQNFYTLKLPPEFPQALRFEQLRTQLHHALGGDEVVRQLVQAHTEKLLDASSFLSITGFLGLFDTLKVTTEIPGSEALEDDSLYVDALLGEADGYEGDNSDLELTITTTRRVSTTGYLQQTLLGASPPVFSPTTFPRTITAPRLSEEGCRLQMALFPSIALSVRVVDAKQSLIPAEPSRLTI